MSKALYQILFLAAVSDGKIHEEEKHLINEYRKNFPILHKLSDTDANVALSELDKLVTAGLSTRQILEKISHGLSTIEKEIGYALAVELCSINFDLVPPETDFLEILGQEWFIDDAIKTAVKKSVMLRYSTNWTIT